LFILAFGFAQNRDAFCLELYKVNMLIQQNHYAPKPINDSLSNYVFNRFIDQLDDDRIIFLKQDLDSLEKHRYRLDDAVFNTECDFINDFITLYTQGLERNLELLKQLKAAPYEAELPDTLKFVSDRAFYDQPEMVKNLYKKRITYEVLDQVARSGTNRDSLYEQLPHIGGDIFRQTVENYQCRIQNLLNPTGGMDAYIKELYFNVFASYFDPHTNYFSTDNKTDFFNSISSTNLSFGLVMEMSATHQVSVQDVLSGSPAFRDPRIEKGDRLIRVQYEEEAYDVNCVNMSMVHNYFYSDTYKKLRLTFRKKNGMDYESRLQKEVLRNYENTSFSFLIEGNKKLGYINVPSFYSNLEGNSTDLYDDFLFEMNHLKSEGAKGFIIDLQNNGGGDMIQAFYLISLFIDRGPVTVLHHRRLPPNVIYNLAEKRMFKEPIVLLINGFTASAGELLAFALQDHHRAILLGQNTYGKGSLQTFFAVNDNEEDTPLLKMTIEQMYRMSGKSHQRKGVTPDIHTPALLAPLFAGEKDYKNALTARDIPLEYTIKGRLPGSHRRAISRGQQRIETQPHYNEIEKLNERVVKQLNEDKPIPLDFKSILASIDSENDFMNALNEVYERNYDLKLSLLKKDQTTIEYNNLLQTMFENKKQRVLTNPDVLEAAYVLLDLL
jgi:carboxyl-terminal processing protease